MTGYKTLTSVLYSEKNIDNLYFLPRKLYLLPLYDG